MLRKGKKSFFNKIFFKNFIFFYTIFPTTMLLHLTLTKFRATEIAKTANKKFNFTLLKKSQDSVFPLIKLIFFWVNHNLQIYME